MKENLTASKCACLPIFKENSVDGRCVACDTPETQDYFVMSSITLKDPDESFRTTLSMSSYRFTLLFTG